MTPNDEAKRFEALGRMVQEVSAVVEVSDIARDHLFYARDDKGFARDFVRHLEEEARHALAREIIAHAGMRTYHDERGGIPSRIIARAMIVRIEGMNEPETVLDRQNALESELLRAREAIVDLRSVLHYFRAGGDRLSEARHVLERTKPWW